MEEDDRLTQRKGTLNGRAYTSCTVQVYEPQTAVHIDGAWFMNLKWPRTVEVGVPLRLRRQPDVACLALS